MWAICENGRPWTVISVIFGVQIMGDYGVPQSEISHGSSEQTWGGYSLFMCRVKIRLQETLGEAGMPLVRCVLVRQELLVQENTRVVQTHCTQSPERAQRKLLCLRCKRFFHFFRTFLWASWRWGGHVQEHQSLSGLGLLVKKSFLCYQDYGRSFCSLKLVKIGQNHKGSAPATGW